MRAASISVQGKIHNETKCLSQPSPDFKITAVISLALVKFLALWFVFTTSL